MTEYPTLLLDVDGVLANFIAGVLAKMKVMFGVDGDHDDVVQWNAEACFDLTAEEQQQLRASWKDPGFCTALPPYDGAVAAVAQLKAWAVVHPLTAPFNSVWWVAERDQWLADHFGFTRKEIVHTEAKHLVKGDVFVDDKPEHVINWQRAHPQGVGILWARPYNEQAPWTGLRTNDWNEVIGIVKALRWIPRR